MTGNGGSVAVDMVAGVVVVVVVLVSQGSLSQRLGHNPPTPSSRQEQIMQAAHLLRALQYRLAPDDLQFVWVLQASPATGCALAMVEVVVELVVVVVDDIYIITGQ